jgi:GWxTD domain-containing protein
MKRALTLALALGTLLGPAGRGAAQEMQRPGPGGERFLPVIFTRAVALPDSGKGRATRVDVWYRIERDFFIKARANDAPLGAPLLRRGDVTVELIDSAAGNRIRAHQSFTRTETDDRQAPGKAWQEGVISLPAPPGTYVVQTGIEDLESRRTFADRSQMIRIGSADSAGLGRAAFFPVNRRAPGMPDSFTPVNFGEDLLFGAPADFVLAWIPASPSDTTVRISMKVSQIPPAESDVPFLPASLDTTLTGRSASRLVPVQGGDGARYDLEAGPAGKLRVAVFSFPTERLLLRTFQIVMHAAAGSDSITIASPARMLWPDMPFSLRDIDNALDALRYVATPKELDSLRDGSQEAKRTNLETFWRKRAPRSTSAYNEVAAEYYRRVDHAIREFGTVRRPDGFRTDRGKVFILYGPPSRIERVLNPTGDYREVWTYDRPKRSFTFVDRTRSGLYILESSAP